MYGFAQVLPPRLGSRFVSHLRIRKLAIATTQTGISSYVRNVQMESTGMTQFEQAKESGGREETNYSKVCTKGEEQQSRR